jgi:hypothetical protein
VRPEMTVIGVRGPGDSRAVPMFGVVLSYHFENHYVTPARRQ